MPAGVSVPFGSPVIGDDLVTGGVVGLDEDGVVWTDRANYAVGPEPGGGLTVWRRGRGGPGEADEPRSHSGRRPDRYE